MKATLLTLIALVLTQTAHAADAERLVGCVEPVETVVTLTISSGYMAEGLASREINLQNDGQAQVNETWLKANGKVTKKSYVSTYSFAPEVMTRIYASLEKITASPLYDLDPKAPVYEDGGSMRLTVNVNGQEIEIAKSQGGHDFLPVNWGSVRHAKFLQATMLNLNAAIDKSGGKGK